MISPKCFGLLAAWAWVATLTNAADLNPIVDLETNMLLGSHTGGKWLPSEKAGPSVKAGTKYRVYGLTEALGTATGKKAAPNADVCPDVFEVELSPKPEKGAIALAAPWNALPRAPRIASTTQPVYLDAVREFLQSKGIKDPKVKITRLLRIDLEGDGEEEVLLSATNYFSTEGVPSSAPANSYSCVLLRRVVGGKVKTQLITGEFYPKGKNFNAPAAYEIAAALDLDGDGKLEVVVRGGYYEGGWTTVYRCGESKIEELLTAACGA